MEQIITKEEFNKIMNLKGEVRGVSLKADAEFILKEQGEEELERIEELITKLGYPTKYNQIKVAGFYPIGLKGINLLAIKRLFNLNDEKFIEMGKFGSRVPFIVRLFMKYFGSIDMLVKEASKMWRRYYTVGDATVIELNKEKRYIILQIRDFRIIQLHCLVLKGYFSGLLQMVVRGEITCEETKCPFRGDEYHEFLLKW